MERVDAIRALAARAISEQNDFKIAYPKQLEEIVLPALHGIAQAFYGSSGNRVTSLSGYATITFQHIEHLPVGLTYAFQADFAARKVLFSIVSNDSPVLSKLALAELATKESVENLVLEELERAIRQMHFAESAQEQARAVPGAFARLEAEQDGQ